MAVSCLAGAFNTGTGALNSTIDVTGSITISGVSAVILFFNGRTDSVDAAGRATRWRGMGFAVGSSDRRCQVSQDADASAAHAGGSYHSNAACIASVATGTATDGLLDFDSWLSNGFRLIVDDVMPRSYRVGFLIITGLTAAATGQWQDSGTTGNKVITNSLSFQPDCEILMATVIDTTPPGGRAGNEMLGMGFAVSTSERATWTGGADEGSATTDTDSYCNDVECLSAMTAGGGTSLASRFDFITHDANGFTLNQLIVPSTIAWNHFLALKGGSFKVVSVATRTDGNDIVTPALGFTPAGVLIVSAFKTEHVAGTPTVHDTWSMGVANSATSRFACSVYSQDGVADTVVYTAIEHDEVYIATTTSAIEGLMDVKSFDTNTITFVMDDVDPSAKFVTMLVFGNVASGTQFNQSVSGGMTPAGVIAKQAQTPKAGGVTPGGIIVKQTQTAKTGGITPAGVMIKQTIRSLVGVLTPSGVISASKMAMKALTGTLTSIGGLVREVCTNKAGDLTPSGLLSKRTDKSFTGTLTSSGVLATVRMVLKSLTGTLSSSGVLVSKVMKNLIGGAAPTGLLSKRADKTFAGTLTSEGVLASMKTFLKAISGTLSSTGMLIRRPEKILIGAPTFGGELINQTRKAFTGALTSSGTLAASRLFSKILGGTLTAAGILSKQAGKILAGVQASAGLLTKQSGKAISGALSWVGNLLALLGSQYVAIVLLTLINRSTDLILEPREGLTLSDRSALLTFEEREDLTLLGRSRNLTIEDER